MSAHFDPILLLLAPAYLIAPNAETLLIIQSVWLASGAIPLFLLASRVIRSSWVALVIAGAYLLHPALHGINMYEFHSLALVVPLLFWVVYLLERQRIVGYWVAPGPNPLMRCQRAGARCRPKIRSGCSIPRRRKPRQSPGILRAPRGA